MRKIVTNIRWSGKTWALDSLLRNLPEDIKIIDSSTLTPDESTNHAKVTHGEFLSWFLECELYRGSLPTEPFWYIDDELKGRMEYLKKLRCLDGSQELKR